MAFLLQLPPKFVVMFLVVLYGAVGIVNLLLNLPVCNIFLFGAAYNSKERNRQKRKSQLDTHI